MNNDETKNYCKINGEPYKSTSSSLLTLKKYNNLECKNCGEVNISKSNYCKLCGVTLEENIESSKSQTKISSGILYNIDIKNILLSVMSSVLILFVVSIILKGVLQTNSTQNSLDIKLSQIVLGLNHGNIVSLNYSMMENSSSYISLGLIALLVFPILAIFISTKLLLKNKIHNIKSALSNSLGFGVVYSLTLVVISLFARSTVQSYNQMLGFTSNYMFGYTMSSVFGKGILIGFLSTFLSINKKEYLNKNSLLEIFSIVMKFVLGIYILVLIFLVGFKLLNIDYTNEMGISIFTSKLNIGVFTTQVAAYIMAMANGGSLIVNEKILNILTINGVSNLKLILYVIMALNALVLLSIGNKLKYKYPKLGIKSVLISSFSYSIIVSLLSVFTRVQLDMTSTTFTIANINSSVFISISMFSIFICSFLFSLIMNLIGYKFNLLDVEY